MYENNKQQQLASICNQVFKKLSEKDQYKFSAIKLLKDADEEKKDKLLNYVKILSHSTTVKNEANIDLELDIIEKKYHDLDNNKLYSIEDYSLVLGVCITLELMTYKSKELKNDIRLKLVQELYNELELHEKQFVFEVQRLLTILGEL